MIWSTHVAVLAVLLGAAAACDLRLRRIPNEIAVALAAAGLGAQLMRAGAGGALSGGAAALVVGSVLWSAWVAGALGGGDLKLGVGAAVWVGLSRLVTFALASALAGGVLALVCYAVSTRGARQSMRANLVHAARGFPIQFPLRSGDGRVSVPAGVALAVGTLVAVSFGG